MLTAWKEGGKTKTGQRVGNFAKVWGFRPQGNGKQQKSVKEKRKNLCVCVGAIAVATARRSGGITAMTDDCVMETGHEMICKERNTSQIVLYTC